MGIILNTFLKSLYKWILGLRDAVQINCKFKTFALLLVCLLSHSSKPRHLIETTSFSFDPSHPSLQLRYETKTLRIYCLLWLLDISVFRCIDNFHDSVSRKILDTWYQVPARPRLCMTWTNESPLLMAALLHQDTAPGTTYKLGPCSIPRSSDTEGDMSDNLLLSCIQPES